MFLFAGRRLRRPEHRPRRRLFECSRPWRRTDRSGRSLRRARPKRTCGTRAAGLRRREAADRTAFPRPKFKILNSKFRFKEHAWTFIPGRAAACEDRRRRKELRAFAAPRLRPARPFQGRFSPDPSLQPSGWARFRAARGCSPPPRGGCGLPVAQRPILPACIYARAAACEAPARADAKADASSGPSRGEAAARCGFTEAANSAFKIQDSKLLLGLQPAEAAHDCKELRASAAPTLRPARPFQGRFLPKAAPQPSGRACDVEEQPSARGRLRAADVRDVASVAKHRYDQRLRAVTGPPVRLTSFAAPPRCGRAPARARRSPRHPC